MSDAEFSGWFWTMVDRGAGADACWPWVGTIDRKGYGVASRRGKSILAHRLAFVLAGHALPPGLPLVLHGCRSRRCCNPAHLSAGDHMLNLGRDRRRDGTIPEGERHWNWKPKVPRAAAAPRRYARGVACGSAKLDDAAVLAIRRRHADGESMSALAREHGVNVSNVHCIVHRKTWRHLR